MIIEARLPSWYRNPALETEHSLPYALFMRSTPVTHGRVIVPPAPLADGEIRPIPDGPIPTDDYIAPYEFSARRYSVVLVHPGNHFELIIGSTYYGKQGEYEGEPIESGFDTEDIDEPLKKYITKEFKTLYRVPEWKTIDQFVDPEDLMKWDGSAQSLQRMFPNDPYPSDIF